MPTSLFSKWCRVGVRGGVVGGKAGVSSEEGGQVGETPRQAWGMSGRMAGGLVGIWHSRETHSCPVTSGCPWG